MLLGIITYYNKTPKFLVKFISFVPVLLTAIYLVLVTAIVLPLAVAISLVFFPLLYVLWRTKKNMSNPVFLRVMYPFELLGLMIVNSPKLVTLIATGTKKIKRPSMSSVKVNKSKGMMLALQILAILGIAGVALYLVVVAVVVLPLAMGLCLLLTPFCYLLWYVKEKKFIPLFHKIPIYLEQIGFNIVNSRKIMTNLMVGMKNFKWPMF
jgi:hypothetical protein